MLFDQSGQPTIRLRAQEGAVIYELHVWEILRIRKSLISFRLRTGQIVVQRVTFHNTEPVQKNRVIVMALNGRRHVLEVVVVKDAQNMEVEEVAGRRL